MERVYSGSPYEATYGFCRALRDGDRIVVAGTAPIQQDGSTTPADPYEQATLCFEIMQAAIDQLADDATVIRTRMFITDPAISDAVGRAHGEAFPDNHPVATMVVVKELLDPAWMVETECEAVVRDR